MWAMVAAACMVLAVVHLFVWIKGRDQHASLWFFVLAVSVAAIAAAEVAMMFATTTDAFATAQRWFHVPLFVSFVSIVVLVRVLLGAGRLWLACMICFVRAVLLVANFTSGASLNYLQVTALRQVSLWGDLVSVADATVNPWTRVAALTIVMFAVYVGDAAVTAWRKGDLDLRRRVLTIAGSIIFVIVTTGTLATLTHEQVIKAPYIIAPTFLIVVLSMSFELGVDLLRVAQLTWALRESERQRHDTEQRIQLATRAAALGFWDLEKDRRKLWLSDTTRALFGFELDHCIEFDALMERVHADDRRGVNESINRVLKDGGEYEGEFRIVSADGATKWLRARGRAESDAGASYVGMRGIVLDITAAKALDMELAQQRNELAHLSRVAMLSEISGSLAHELNQPLAAILSNAQAAQRLLCRTPIDVDEVRAILTDMEADDKRAGEVIGRLRFLLKKEEAHYVPCQLAEIVRDVVRLMRSDLLNRGVTVHQDYVPGLPMVSADEVQLQQVFLNLIINACDAMADNARAQRQLALTIRADEEGYVEACVIDQGKGIPIDGLERIFEPFFTSKPDGMGLGLSVCRTIITVHGGRIWATNNPTRGATIHVALPRYSGSMS